jgi:hypothetical protein
MIPPQKEPVVIVVEQASGFMEREGWTIYVLITCDTM